MQSWIDAVEHSAAVEVPVVPFVPPVGSGLTTVSTSFSSTAVSMLLPIASGDSGPQNSAPAESKSDSCNTPQEKATLHAFHGFESGCSNSGPKVCADVFDASAGNGETRQNRETEHWSPSALPVSRGI